jgi:hypothetical protein
MKRQDFFHCPAMISDASSHRGRQIQPRVTSDQARQTKAPMLGAEIIDGPDQVHPPAQGVGLASQGSPPATEAVQPLAKGGVESFNEGDIDLAPSLRLLDDRVDLFCRALNDASHDADDAPPSVLFDRLSDANVRPRLQEGTPTSAVADRVAEDAAHGGDVGLQSIGAKQDRSGQRRRAATDLLDQTGDQAQISLDRDHPAQPQARLDHQGHRHPHHLPLFFDTKLIGLHLTDFPWLLDQVVVHGLAVLPSTLVPVPHCPLVQAKGGYNGLHRTAMGEQRHHHRHHVLGFLQPVERRPPGLRKRLVADVTEVASFLVTMDADVTSSNFSSGGAVHIRAKYFLWVHRRNPSLFLNFKGLLMDPSLFNPSSLHDSLWSYLGRIRRLKGIFSNPPFITDGLNTSRQEYYTHFLLHEACHFWNSENDTLGERLDGIMMSF